MHNNGLYMFHILLEIEQLYFKLQNVILNTSFQIDTDEKHCTYHSKIPEETLSNTYTLT